jgi:hypothetical protein
MKQLQIEKNITTIDKGDLKTNEKKYTIERKTSNIYCDHFNTKTNLKCARLAMFKTGDVSTCSIHILQENVIVQKDPVPVVTGICTLLMPDLPTVNKEQSKEQKKEDGTGHKRVSEGKLDKNKLIELLDSRDEVVVLQHKLIQELIRIQDDLKKALDLKCEETSEKNKTIDEQSKKIENLNQKVNEQGLFITSSIEDFEHFRKMAKKIKDLTVVIDGKDVLISLLRETINNLEIDSEKNQKEMTKFETHLVTRTTKIENLENILKVSNQLLEQKIKELSQTNSSLISLADSNNEQFKIIKKLEARLNL